MLESKIADVIGKQKLLQLAADTSVAEAAKRMAQHHVGAMLVCEGQVMRGIFTERDMLERVVAADLSPGATPLRDVMTPDPASIAADATLLQAIFAMKAHFTRHLLVRRGEDLIGIVSVRDLLRAVVDSRIEERQRFDDLWDGFPV
ncbi:MAG: CBS domain-containing protein [Kiloniellales bacterium]|nr:CBS domain-containing protein [Kiloniellales bacterium]